MGCESVRQISDANEKANFGGKQTIDSCKPVREVVAASVRVRDPLSTLSNVEALLERVGGRDNIEGAEESAGPSAALMDLDLFSGELVWCQVVSIPHKDSEPAEERGSVLGGRQYSFYIFFTSFMERFHNLN